MLKNLVINSINALLKPFTYQFKKKLRNNNHACRVISLYPNDKFAEIRFWDAPLLEVDSFVPKKGTIVDLGCGDGFFANFMALSSLKRTIIGIELNKERIKHAHKGLKNTKFIAGDITKVDLPKADTVILFHVLHHLNSFKQQEELLCKCLEKIKKGGKLLIVEAEPKASYKYLLAWFVDHFLVSWIFDKKLYSSIYFRQTNEWTSILNKIGFKTSTFNLEKNKPFPHILIEAIKY